MKKYSLEDLRQIYESKRYLTKDRFVHYFVNRYGYSEKASKQAFRLFLEFPKGIYDDEDKKTLDVIIPNAIDLVNGIMNNSHIGYDLDKEKEYKKIIFKENDVVNETVVDMNNSDDIGTYAEIIKRKVDTISSCDKVYNVHHGETNKETDETYTPMYAVEPLVKYIPKGFKIWCPFDKDWSAYVQVFRSKGYNVVCSHIDEGKDFFEYEPKEYDIIVSNPPFSISTKILSRLYDLRKPFVMLLPLKYLQSVERCRLFSKHGLELLSFDSRVGYYTWKDFSKPKEGNYQASSYFCWNVLPEKLIIENLKKDKRSLK